jgi:hypothetical protein
MNLEVSGLLGLIWLAFVIYVIIRIIGSSAGPGAKALWIVLVLLVPVVGVILWFLVGPKGR